MSTRYLEFVNAVLKRTRTIAGDAGELATSTVTSTATGLTATGAFTDSGRQTQIDLALQLSNEAFHEVFGLGLFAEETSTATITLSSGTREYSLPSDFERIAGRDYVDRALRGATTGRVTYEYPGGYARMLRDQPNATDFTGDHSHWAISPTNLQTIRLDAEPTSDQDGETWNILYEKRISFTSTMATDTLPFSDTVADALVPVVAEGHNRIMKKEFDSSVFRTSIVRSMEYLRQNQKKSRYGKR